MNLNKIKQNEKWKHNLAAFSMFVGVYSKN